MNDPQPGIRRLCVAVTSGPPHLLRRTIRALALDRLYLNDDSDRCAELALAPPGVDEPTLVADLISTLHETNAVGTAALAAFHVGITRILCDRFDGAAVLRTSSLLRELAAHTTPHTAAGSLSVIMSSSLFTELQYERQLGEGWRPIPETSAWIRLYQPTKEPEMGNRREDQSYATGREGVW
jgi:hypothetical protein